jgi:hypothetical protein
MVVVASSAGGFSGHDMVVVEAGVAPTPCLLGEGRSVLVGAHKTSISCNNVLGKCME